MSLATLSPQPHNLKMSPFVQCSVSGAWNTPVNIMHLCSYNICRMNVILVTKDNDSSRAADTGLGFEETLIGLLSRVGSPVTMGHPFFSGFPVGVDRLSTLV